MFTGLWFLVLSCWHKNYCKLNFHQSKNWVGMAQHWKLEARFCFGNGCVFVVVPSCQCISQMVFLNCWISKARSLQVGPIGLFHAFLRAHEQLHLFRKMKRTVLGGRQVCRNMMERTFTCCFACKTRSKRGGGLQKGARSLYVPSLWTAALFCWKTKNHNLQDVVKRWETRLKRGRGATVCLPFWSLWSHTKSNRPLIWWLRPWKSSPPSEEDVRGRAWSFSRQREGSFNSQHQDVWIKDKPSGDCHILQAYTATCQQRFFRLSGNFNSYIGFNGLKFYKWISAGHILSRVNFTFPTGPDCRDVATCGLRARFCGSHLAWEFAEAFFRHRSVVLGTLETVLCPSLSRVYSVYSLNSKLMVMTMMGF